MSAQRNRSVAVSATFTDLVNALAQRGHDLYVGMRPNSEVGKFIKIPTRNIATLPLRNALDADSARRVTRFVKDQGIEIVHAHMARDYAVAAYACRKNRKTRFVVSRHVLFPLNPLHKIVLSQAARIIAVSEAVAAQLRTQKLVPAERIAVIYNGVDCTRFEKAKTGFNREQFFRSWNFPDNSFLVGTVAELKPLKGQEEFLRAAKQVARAVPNVHFIIAGVDSSATEENRHFLARLVNEFDLADRVRLVGWLNDVDELLCGLDVFISASRTESFGLAIAEAMACGTAVVATETSGAQEIIDPGKTGLLVPILSFNALAESVIELLENNQRRERIAKQGREWVCARFSLDRMVTATEALYREIVESRSQ